MCKSKLLVSLSEFPKSSVVVTVIVWPTPWPKFITSSGVNAYTHDPSTEDTGKFLLRIVEFIPEVIFKDNEDKKLPLTSKMQNKSSDIVGNFNFQPNNQFKLDYDFSFDNNLDTVNYSKVETQLSINNFVTSFDFLEENGDIGSDSYLLSDARYNFDKNNSVSYNTRRNRKTDLTEYYNLVYEYKNDCLVAGIEYNKEYYQDRDLKPSEQIFFSLTFTPFTTISTPSF